VFISKEGYILTNNHVVEDTKEVTIVLFDGSQEKATIVGTDMFADLAVLKVEGQVPAIAILGNSDVLNPGETVIAIGSPLGDFKNTVTVGVVSATRPVDRFRSWISNRGTDPDGCGHQPGELWWSLNEPGRGVGRDQYARGARRWRQCGG
jgi:hypothetical protein